MCKQHMCSENSDENISSETTILLVVLFLVLKTENLTYLRNICKFMSVSKVTLIILSNNSITSR